MPGLCGSTNAYHFCDLYYLLVIIRVRCPFPPPPRFDATDATFPLTNICKPINASLVGSPPIFGSMGVGKSTRTPLTLLVAPAIMPHTLGGIDGGFVPWYNLSNLLKSYMQLARFHLPININGLLYKFMSILGWYN